MAALLARRVIQAVAVLLGVAIITFLLLHYLPADPAALVAGRSANAQMIANVRHQLGLDLPLPLQFWRYLTGLVRGDLGRSYIQRSEVATLVMARIPATLVLMACGILVEVALGLTFGVIAALRRNGFVDRVVMMFAFVGVSSPQFVVALLLLYVFAASPWLVSDERLRHAGPCRSAGADAWPAGRRMVRAHGAFGDDRRAQSGLCPHSPRQRPERAHASFCGTPCQMRFCRSSR